MMSAAEARTQAAQGRSAVQHNALAEVESTIRQAVSYGWQSVQHGFQWFPSDTDLEWIMVQLSAAGYVCRVVRPGNFWHPPVLTISWRLP